MQEKISKRGSTLLLPPTKSTGDRDFLRREKIAAKYFSQWESYISK
jgi:hypothetical protein